MNYNENMERKFEHACAAYREQFLDAIVATKEEQAFGAVTLACCAIDLLSHTLYEPRGKSQRADCFKKTVRKKLGGYKDDAFADRLYGLRCGLVHEFRTHSDSGRVYLTANIGEPQFKGASDGGDYLLVDAAHFCDAVIKAFQKFFTDAGCSEQRRFIERAFIEVINPPVSGFTEGAVPGGDVSTDTLPASGTGGPSVEHRASP